MKKVCIPIEEVYKLIGDDRRYEQFNKHTDNDRLWCICNECYYTKGINKQKQIMRDALKDYERES